MIENGYRYDRKLFWNLPKILVFSLFHEQGIKKPLLAHRWGRKDLGTYYWLGSGADGKKYKFWSESRRDHAAVLDG